MSASIVLLCEDASHDTFIRRFLRKRNIKGREIVTLPLPRGKQSGEYWVRSKFPDELKAIRSRSNGFLVVVIDADTRSRVALKQACEARGVPPERPDDPVAVIVPRRNIETWLEFLNGRPVNEEQSYPKGFTSKDVRRLAERLYQICHVQQRLPDTAPPSLAESCAEYAKLRR